MFSVIMAMVAMQPDERPWVNPPQQLAEGVAHHVLWSEANQREIGYSLYSPPGSPKGRTLVVFLHGSGGSESSDCVPGGFTQTLADAGYGDCAILFVNGRMSGYQDHPERGEFIQTHLIKELLPEVERAHGVGGSRAKRLLCGFSMGGAGACLVAFTHPDLFSGAIAWGGSQGRGESVLEALQRGAEQLRQSGFRLAIVAGDQDDFARASDLVAALEEEKIKHRYIELKGIGHDLGAYYRLSAKDAFEFALKR